MISKIIIFSLLLAGAAVPAFAQMQTTQSQVTIPTIPVSITTDKQSYADGDRMTISGSVRELVSDLPVTIEIRDPSGSIVMISQVHPDTDRTFTVGVTAGGFLWKSAGTYYILAQYGSSSRSDTIHFQFSGHVPSQTIVVSGTNVTISYSITSGVVNSVLADPSTKAIIISASTTAPGNLTITLPRTLIDAKAGAQDASFVVTDHGTPVKFLESKSSVSRTLTIPFSGPAAESLMIKGTQIVPEFGPVAPLILSLAVILVFLLARTDKLGFVRSRS